MSRLLSLLVIFSGFAFGAGMAVFTLAPVQADRVIKVSGKALVGGPFQLTDHSGKRVSEANYAGQYKLIYFGFTTCPDICPGSLQVMTEALNRLPQETQDKITPLFITVDPERDTPEQLASYVESFDKRMIGLTGSPEEIRAAAKVFRVFYSKVKTGDGPNDYTMDHSSIIFLMAPDGAYLGSYSHGVKVPALVTALSENVK